MRILHLFTRFSMGGVPRHVLALVGGLRALGHQVWIGGASGEWMDERRDPQFVHLPFDRVAAPGNQLWRRLASVPVCARPLRRLVSQERIQIIHCHETAPALVARLAAVGTDATVVLSYHGRAEREVPSFARSARLMARQLIAVSEDSARRLSAAGVPAAMIDVVTYGVPRGPEGDRGAVARLRKRLLGPTGNRLLVSVCRLHRQKGIDVLVEAFARVQRERPATRLVIVGEGPEREALKSAIRAADLEASLLLEGSSDDPYSYLAAADAFVLASRWEARPLVIAEAFRRALPVVATDVGGVREMVDDSVGFLVPAGDATSLARAILRVCDEDGLRQRLSAAAAVRGEDPSFSVQETSTTMEGIYERLLETARVGWQVERAK